MIRIKKDIVVDRKDKRDDLSMYPQQNYKELS